MGGEHFLNVLKHADYGLSICWLSVRYWLGMGQLWMGYGLAIENLWGGDGLAIGCYGVAI